MNNHPRTRDFDINPKQAGGRTQVDYGHTILDNTQEPSLLMLFIPISAGITMIAAALFIGYVL